MVEPPLPPFTLRALAQKEYDKRKAAAVEVEHTIQELREGGNMERVANIVQYIVEELAQSPLPNVRKGALHALAGAAIGLREEVPTYLPQILPPVLASFTDPDCRVRYYACESLYNIAKVARIHCVAHFNDIFEALFKLSADTDLGVQNGFQLLDRLMKDVVAESGVFEIASFMPLLKRRIYVANSYTRQFLIGWISILDAVPAINMLEHLPGFFDGLFHMLSDPNKEIRQQAYAVLFDFLQEIKTSAQVDYAPVVGILVQHCASRDRFSRLTAITWLHDLANAGQGRLLPFASTVLEAVLKSISHAEEEIRDAAMSTDRALRALLSASGEGEFDVAAIVVTLIRHMRSDKRSSRLSALEWLAMLLDRSPAALVDLADSVWPPLLTTLGDESEAVVQLSIEVVARFASQPDYFSAALGRLVQTFSESPELLEARSPLIVRRLSTLLNPEDVFRELSRLIDQSEDVVLNARLVQTLNAILHTSPALGPLREQLRAAMTTKEGAALFISLHSAWCHDPVALLSMCLLAQVRPHPLPALAPPLELSLRGRPAGLRACRGPHPRLRHLRDGRGYAAAAGPPRPARGGTGLRPPPPPAARAGEATTPPQRPLRPSHAPPAGAGRSSPRTGSWEREDGVRSHASHCFRRRQSSAFETLQQRLGAVPQLGLLRLSLGVRDKDTKAPKDAKRAVSVDFVALQRTFEAVQLRHREHARAEQNHARLSSSREATGAAAPAPAPAEQGTASSSAT